MIKYLHFTCMCNDDMTECVYYPLAHAHPPAPYTCSHAYTQHARARAYSQTFININTCTQREREECESANKYDGMIESTEEGNVNFICNIQCLRGHWRCCHAVLINSSAAKNEYCQQVVQLWQLIDWLIDFTIIVNISALSLFYRNKKQSSQCILTESLSFFFSSTDKYSHHYSTTVHT